MNKDYLKINLPTPEIFKNKNVDGSALVIGTGLSTEKLLKYKDIIRKKFDAVVGLNFATNDFEDQLDYHLVLEKNPVQTYTQMKSGKYRKDLPRILNFKSLNKFPKDINVIKATRCNFDGKPDIREYSVKNNEGFINGPVNAEGFSVGSVGMHGLHFAGILGCSKVYMIGIDLVFGKYDHYYGDMFYRKCAVKENKSKLIKIEHNGCVFDTSQFFKDSADFINMMINTQCKSKNISVFSFGDGLITAANKINIDDFFNN